MLRPVSVRAMPDYRLQVRYEDGAEGVVDLSHLVGQGVFAVWNDPRAFERVSIGSSGAICWGGEIDLCPDAIYMQMTGKSPEEVFPNLAKTNVHA